MIQIDIPTWSEYKSVIASKSLLIQYSETAYTYEIYASESAFLWAISLLKGSSDATDFENNYKASANAPLLDFPNYTYINSSGTTTIKSGLGKLHQIIFGKTGTLVTTSFTIYDNIAASGNIICVAPYGTGAVNAYALDFHVKFSTGLTIVSDNSSNSLTVIWE